MLEYFWSHADPGTFRWLSLVSDNRDLFWNISWITTLFYKLSHHIYTTDEFFSHTRLLPCQ